MTTYSHFDAIFHLNCLSLIIYDKKMARGRQGSIRNHVYLVVALVIQEKSAVLLRKPTNKPVTLAQHQLRNELVSKRSTISKAR